MDNLYLENLDEYINDEKRTVTYKWLSHTLSVHINQAKQMLYSFVQKQRTENENACLCVTYFLSGLTGEDSEQVHHCRIVREEHLSAAKQRYHPITSCHVYSVSKAKVKDTSTLYAADYDVIKENIMQSNKHSAIRCKQAQARSEADLEQLRQRAQPTSESPSFARPNTGQDQSKSKKQGGIAGMFASGQQKKKPEVSSGKQNNTESLCVTAKPTESDNKKSNNKQNKGAIANFFANQATKPKKQNQEKEKEEEKETTSPSNKNCDKTKHTSAKTQGKSKKKHREDSDEEEVRQKKRRRIRAVVMSDSSEDEQQGPATSAHPSGARDSSDKMEEEREATPPPSPPHVSSPEADIKEASPVPSPEAHVQEASPVPSPEKIREPLQESTTGNRLKEKQSESSVANSGVKKRKRQKKLVSKSFVDEDGFMVTEKVWESDSETDDEIIPPTPPVKTARPPANSNAVKEKSTTASKKASPVTKGRKQATLMSFFKKK